ncbi:hypothetical protein SUNI508_10189 [Seiridium unicorne]|uniref:Uncharacterized protein n=1 Tax=Seiridium unicorne TaxID=138068 RepID=A0ABR2UMB0_9PEZI
MILYSYNVLVSISIAILLATIVQATNHQHPIHSDKMPSLNVFKKPLHLFSTQPMTGFYRDGFCRTSVSDPGNHAVAGIVSDEFLQFSASQGNDLRTVGLTGGCKWCLCTTRWLEAVQAFKDGRISQNGVPKVDLDATEDSALKSADFETFKQFAVKKEEVNGN